MSAVVALVLGVTMIVVGLLTMLSSNKHPEIATGGATLMLATGMLGANGNENGSGRSKR